MTHTYSITGMTCAGCRSTVENALNSIDGIKASVSLDPPVATLEMHHHIATEKLQEVLPSAGPYTIAPAGTGVHNHYQHNIPSYATAHTQVRKQQEEAPGKYYCPMHCEGGKLYDRPGNCPVCG